MLYYQGLSRDLSIDTKAELSYSKRSIEKVNVKYNNPLKGLTQFSLSQYLHMYMCICVELTFGRLSVRAAENLWHC